MNELYPIFLKLSTLEVLIIGGGSVGLEKLNFLLKSSPGAKVTVVSNEFMPEIMALALKYRIEIIRATYDKLFISEKHIVIAATDNNILNLQIHTDCKERNILVNVADNPILCDFFMGGIVTKGNLKLAISTNGKSPTIAKRLRQFFEEILPDEIDELVENLHQFRKNMKGNFEDKVKNLNELTRGLINKDNE